MNTWNQEQLNQLPKEMLVQLYLQMSSALDTIMEQNRKITEQNERQARQIEALQENLAVLVQNRFGRKTEKVKQTDGQYSLDFDTMTLVLTALFPDGYTELPAEKMRPLLEYTPAHMQQVINHVHIDNDEFEFDEPDDEQTFRTQIVEYDKQVEMEQRSFVNWQLSLCCQNIAKSVNILEKCILKKPYYGMMIKHWRNSKNEPIDDVTSRISYEK